MLLGFYDYTVILTYMSLFSAGLGIFVSLNGEGHPYLGIFFLLMCGLCDAFDGKVARTKKNRTESEVKFGIQIDSLCDLIAFGVLPACIGNAMIRVCPTIEETPRRNVDGRYIISISILLFVIMLIYILAALIRLAYFNVEEELRQKTETETRKYYSGVPVTSAALVFPTILLMQYILPLDITMVYFAFMVLLSFLFLSKVHIKKPGTLGIVIMVLIGVCEFAALIVFS